MTKSNIWSQMRLINYIMQNICGVTSEHRINTIAQNCLEYLKDEGRISSFEINMKDNNILNINIPDMFVLDFDITTNEVTIECMGHIEDQEILIDVGIYDKKEKDSQSGQFEKMREELRMYRIFPGPMNRHYYGIDPFAPRHIVSLQLGTFYIKLLLDTLESNTPEWQWPELKRHLHYILTDYMIERENAMADLSMEEKDDRRS